MFASRNAESNLARNRANGQSTSGEFGRKGLRVTTRPRFVHSPTRCLLFAVVAIGEAAISNAEVDASCTSNFERSHARVTAITKNGVLALADGRTAHLE